MSLSLISKTFHFAPITGPGIYKAGPSGYHLEKMSITGKFNEDFTVFHMCEAETHEEFVLNFYDIDFQLNAKNKWKVDQNTVSEGVGQVLCECMRRDWHNWMSEVVEEWLNSF